MISPEDLDTINHPFVVYSKLIAQLLSSNADPDPPGNVILLPSIKLTGVIVALESVNVNPMIVFI